jgi:hypothetical protein
MPVIAIRITVGGAGDPIAIDRISIGSHAAPGGNVHPAIPVQSHLHDLRRLIPGMACDAIDHRDLILRNTALADDLDLPHGSAVIVADCEVKIPYLSVLYVETNPGLRLRPA